MRIDYSDLRVLLIDDQPVARQYMRGVLAAAGIEQVVEAGNAQAALQAVTERGSTFDLALCDLRMPGKDGIEIIRMLADLGLQCAVAILSVEDERVIESAGRLAKLRGLNLVGAISKPLTEEKLESIVGAMTAARQRKLPTAPVVSEAELAQAFSRGEIELHYQPKIQMVSGECIGGAATVRWGHPVHGMLGPEEIIPACEASPALLAQLTRVSLRDALSTCGRWQADGRGLSVSIGISPLAFDHLDFPDRLEAMAFECSVLPDQVTIEVRESTLTGSPALLVDIAARLRIKGFRLALDHFTGRLAAMEQILAVPFSEIKLDPEGVDGCAVLPAKRAIVEAGLALARNLRLTSVAVGVANRPDWELLTTDGCYAAQGPFIARPMPESGFGIWASQWMLHRQRS